MVSLKKVKVFVCPLLGINLFELFQEEELQEISVRFIFMPKHMHPMHGLGIEINTTVSPEDIEMAMNL